MVNTTDCVDRPVWSSLPKALSQVVRWDGDPKTGPQACRALAKKQLCVSRWNPRFPEGLHVALRSHCPNACGVCSREGKLDRKFLTEEPLSLSNSPENSAAREDGDDEDDGSDTEDGL